MIKRIKPFTETPEPENINADYFYRMLSPQALKHSRPYNNEEEKILKQLLSHEQRIKCMNFIAVGGGELWYLKYGLEKARDYVLIEPLLPIYLNKSVRYLSTKNKNIFLISKKFNDVKRKEIPEGNSFFVFLFNILAYIPRPVAALNNIIRAGDILFLSSWGKTTEARQVRKKYFDFLNDPKKKAAIDPEKTIGLCHFDKFPFNSLKFYKKHERIRGKIVDILIIYT